MIASVNIVKKYDNFKINIGIGDETSSSDSEIESEDKKISDNDQETEALTSTLDSMCTHISTESPIATHVAIIAPRSGYLVSGDN